MTGLDKKLEQLKIKLLADGGYSYILLVTPDDCESKTLALQQKDERSVVENLNAAVANNWAVAREVFRGSPLFQAVCLMIVYQVEAMVLEEFPLRFLSELKEYFPMEVQNQ